jgi:hypothetical protein
MLHRLLTTTVFLENGRREVPMMAQVRLPHEEASARGPPHNQPAPNENQHNIPYLQNDDSAELSSVASQATTKKRVEAENGHATDETTNENEDLMCCLQRATMATSLVSMQLWT